MVHKIRCFPCPKTKAGPTLKTYQCFKIKALNKVRKKIVSLSCIPSSGPRSFELRFSYSQWSAVTYYANYSFALRHTITSPKEFLCICNTCCSTWKFCTLPSQIIYRVSQEECARLREGVPYVKVYRYNPKHLCPKLNGYGDNGQRSLKLWQLLHTCWLPNTY